IGEDEHTVVALDDPDLPTRIAWQARMGRRIDVAGSHTLAGLEFGSHGDIASLGAAIGKPRRYFGGGERRDGLLRPLGGPPYSDLGARGQATRGEQLHDLRVA